MIQALCRWRTAASVKIYARINPRDYAARVRRMSQTDVDSTISAHLPSICDSELHANMGPVVNVLTSCTDVADTCDVYVSDLVLLLLLTPLMTRPRDASRTMLLATMTIPMPVSPPPVTQPIRQAPFLRRATPPMGSYHCNPGAWQDVNTEFSDLPRTGVSTSKLGRM